MARPTVFVGSSTEGIDLARAVQEQLSDNNLRAVLWKEDETFSLSRSTLESLLVAIERYDFAVMVFSPDDESISRGLRSLAPRDNVVFELGLFMARLGRGRTFVVLSSNQDVKVPSDLKGVTFAVQLASDQRDDDLLSAVGPACNKIRRQVKQLGVRSSSEQETGVLYRLLNACTYPYYPDVRIDLLERIAHKIPESFVHLEEVVEFIEDMFRDYIRPLLTDARLRSLRVYFAYFLGDGVIVQEDTPPVKYCVDRDSEAKPFNGEFVIAISNPEVYPEPAWRIGRAIAGYYYRRPASNCARVFKALAANYKNDLSDAYEQADNYTTPSELSVYSVPVQWRTRSGNASIGVIAVSSPFPNSIPERLMSRVEFLTTVVGYVFSLYAAHAIFDEDEKVEPTRIGYALVSETDLEFVRSATALRRRIARYFEMQRLGDGLHVLESPAVRYVDGSPTIGKQRSVGSAPSRS